MSGGSAVVWLREFDSFSAQLFVSGYRAVYACVFLFGCIFPIDSLLFFLSNGFMP